MVDRSEGRNLFDEFCYAILERAGLQLFSHHDAGEFGAVLSARINRGREGLGLRDPGLTLHLQVRDRLLARNLGVENRALLASCGLKGVLGSVAHLLRSDLLGLCAVALGDEGGKTLDLGGGIELGELFSQRLALFGHEERLLAGALGAFLGFGLVLNGVPLLHAGEIRLLLQVPDPGLHGFALALRLLKRLLRRELGLLQLGERLIERSKPLLGLGSVLLDFRNSAGEARNVVFDLFAAALVGGDGARKARVLDLEGMQGIPLAGFAGALGSEF